MARVKDPSHFIFYHCKVLTHVVLVVVLCALKAVLKLVIIFVHLVIVRAYVLCHVVQIHALEDQVMTVMVTCVIPVAVLHVEEIVVLARAVLDVVLLVVIYHVIIGVIMCVHKEHRVELLLVRPQADIIMKQDNL